jgi:hypothetical protein
VKRSFPYVFLAVLVLVVGLGCLLESHERPADAQALEPSAGLAETGAPGGESKATIDLKQRRLAVIPVGTVIEKTAPEGWSHLVLIAVPTLTEEDERDSKRPKMATRYAQMFKFTVLANVVRQTEAGKPPFYLEKVARGFATDLNGKETIISSENTMKARMGLFGKTILEENEKCLDNDVKQVVRTPTMLMFDAKAVMLRDGDHQTMIIRHAIVVDPNTGKLYTLVWLLGDDYQPAEAALQLLPNNMWEKRLLSIKRDKFTAGIPSRDAFGLRLIPQGKAVPYTPQLKAVATVKDFEETQVPNIENTLRAAAIKATEN